MAKKGEKNKQTTRQGSSNRTQDATWKNKDRTTRTKPKTRGYLVTISQFKLEKSNRHNTY